MIAAAAIGIYVIPPLDVFFQWVREKIKARLDMPGSAATEVVHPAG